MPAAWQAAPPPSPPMQAPMQPMPAAAPVRRGTSPIVWILVIVGGLFVLGIIGVVGTGFFLVHKAKQVGLDPNLISRNPGYAIAKMAIAANPDISEVGHDDSAGTVTVRDRKTGEVTTLSFDDIKNGRFKFTARDAKGETATMEFGAGADKLPSWVPAYPGASAKGTFSITGNSGDGSGEGGNFTYTTPDPVSKVMDFYKDKARDLGMKVNVTTTTDKGEMMIASDEDSKRSLTVVAGESNGETGVNITYARKN